MTSQPVSPQAGCRPRVGTRSRAGLTLVLAVLLFSVLGTGSAVAGPAIQPAKVAVIGTARVGSTLTASPGSWRPSGLKFSYQWLRSGKTIKSATTSRYTVTAGDYRTTISVRVTGQKTGYNAVARTSQATKPVALGVLSAGTPVVNGRPVVGSKLTASAGSWGPKGVQISYQWLRSGKAIKGATESAYALGGSDRGAMLVVKVTGRKAGYATASRTSKATAPVTAPIVPGNLVSSIPVIAGNTTLGSTLSVNVGTWGPAPVSLQFQWLRNGAPIGGANQITYGLGFDDVGQMLSVRVTGVKSGYTSVTQTSGQTGRISSPGAATVMATTQRMSAATLNSSQNGWYGAGSRLSLVCYVRGQSVKGYFSGSFAGGWDNIWYKVSDGYFVADVDLQTGTLDPVADSCPTVASGVENFVANNNGKVLSNVAGTYPGQCVSLISQYLLQVYGITSGAWGNAIDYRAGGSGGNQLSARGFSWHSDTGFQNGDILVWGQGRYTTQYGHVAVWYNGRIFDQNYAGRMSAGLDPYFPYGFIGYWRR